jgi:hypothetical protein
MGEFSSSWEIRRAAGCTRGLQAKGAKAVALAKLLSNARREGWHGLGVGAGRHRAIHEEGRARWRCNQRRQHGGVPASDANGDGNEAGKVEAAGE